MIQIICPVGRILSVVRFDIDWANITANVSLKNHQVTIRIWRIDIMITIDDVKQISQKISLENGISDDNLSEDVSEIVYRIDVLECDDTPIIDRHIDIEYSFGDYYEVHEENPLFQFICALCNLSLAQGEEEIILFCF